MNLRQDLRVAVRAFAKSPLFSTVAVLSIALGVGANTAIFSLMDQIMVRMLPVKQPEQLVLLSPLGRHYGNNMGRNRISYPMYQDFRDHNVSFSGMFCFREVEMSVTFNGHSTRVAGEVVSGNYFSQLGVTAAIGRLFTASDDQFQNAHPVAVLSYSYWQTRFAGNPRILGQKLNINGYPFTVIGVSQAGFAGTDPTYNQQIRVPMMMSSKIGQYMNLNDRRSRWVTAFARLKPGVTAKGAKAAMQPLFHQILRMEVQLPEFAKAPPEMKKAFLQMSMDVLPAANGRSDMRRQFEKPLLVLMASVAFVLLIACANVASLLIARATSRQKEIAMRLALGSSRRRIISQLVLESVLLSVAGGITGLAVAMWTDRALLALLPAASVPLNISPIPDMRVLLFNLTLSVLTGVLFGVIPAMQSTTPDLSSTLKDHSGAVLGGSSTRVRKLLVVSQISLSLLLLIGAGLFIRSLQNLKDLDPGFRTSNLLSFRVDPTLSGYTPERATHFYSRLKENLETTPSVVSAALAVMPVLTGDEWDQWVTIDSYSPKPGELPDPHMNFLFPDYFKTLEIPLLSGRDFRMTDDPNAPKVCIVNEAFAKKYFGTANAVGHKIGMGIDPGTKTDITVIGVARNTKYEGIRQDTPMEVYRPYAQLDFATGIAGYVRTTRDPEQVFTAIRRRIHDLDPNLPVFEMTTVEQLSEDSLVTERMVASLSTVFGFLATVLAAIGLYGVTAYTVARRTREFGIRMAIGAARANVLWIVMRDVLALLAVGFSIALPSAWVLTRYVRSQLYGVDPADPASIASAAVIIACIAIAAGWIPARRATRIDPMTALRYE